MKALVHREWLATAIVLIAGVAALRAQESQDVPTIEPTLTRLYGSDSLNFRRDFGAALSPDGRWMVFANFEGADRVNLWLADVESGEAHRLTDGRYFDGAPLWFPRGDRIAFRSTRFAGPEQEAAFIAVLAIDTVSGRPLGPPRQITLEQADNWGFDISPDGRWIVYSTPASDRSLPAWGREAGGMALQVVPATGGAARTLAVRERFVDPTWTPNGDSVYFSAPVGEGDSALTTVFGVSVRGGETRILTSWLHGNPPEIAPGARYFARRGEDVWEIRMIDGELSARFELPERMSLVGFASSRLDMLAGMQNTVAPLRVMPVAGGPPRQLTESRAYEVPLGWAAGGEEIFFRTTLNGQQVYMLAPIDGGAMRQAPLPSHVYDYPRVLEDGMHVAYVAEDEQTARSVLSIMNLETGEAREISRSIVKGTESRAWLQDAREVLFVERTGDELELKSVTPDGSPRLLWKVSIGQEPEGGSAVHGDRIAFTYRAGDSTILYVGERGDTAARRVLVKEGRIALRGMWHPVFSPSGRLLVLPYMPPGATHTDVLVVEFDASGSLAGEPRVLSPESGPRWWFLTKWLPDESGFLVLGMGAEGIMDTNVWLISLDPHVAPVALTADDPHDVWNFRLSPDGRYVVYSSETQLGGSIWKVELGEIPEPVRR